MTAMDSTIETVRRLAERAKRNPKSVGVLSTGEYIAVAMVLNKPRWLSGAGYTMLQAMDRLGEDWTAAALIVQKYYLR